MNRRTIGEPGYLKLLIFFIPIIIMLTGCGLLDSDNDERLHELEKPEVELIPLAVGNYWVYEQWQIEPTWLDTVRNKVLLKRDVIIENTKVQAYGTYRFRYDQQPREDALITLSANGTEGHYSLGFDAPFDSLNRLTKGLRYKFPANPGDAWEHTAIVYNLTEQELRIGETRTFTLMDTTKTVVTPAGIFENCYVYRFFDFQTASLVRHYMFIKPMVGLVGVDSYAGEDLYAQQRLLEYNIENKSP